MAQTEDLHMKARAGLEGLELFSIHFSQEVAEPGCPISPAALVSRFKDVADLADVEVFPLADEKIYVDRPVGHIYIYIVPVDYRGICAVTMQVEFFTRERITVQHNGKSQMDEFVFWERGITLAGSKNDIQSALEDAVTQVAQRFVTLWKDANP